jgi:small-conductance mechanosensitive channel
VDLLTDVVAGTHNLMLTGIAVLVGLNQLTLSPRLESMIDHGFTLLLLSQVGLWAHRAIRGWRAMQTRLSRESDNGAAAMNYGFIAFLLEMALWIILILMVLDNLGVNITTLVASLGIGGIAIALAVQNILGDLFASLSIALDKPFVAGDFIIIDGMMGSVKNVGLKTTRIQSLSGEELIFSNADLLKSRIRNFKRMAERRVVFQIGLVFGTPAEKLKRVNEIIRDAVLTHSDARLDRTHFKAIGASSLDFEVVYYVLSPDYTRYMDIQQAINLALMERLESEGISFAFPTQTLHIDRARATPPSPGDSHIRAE